ncbi:MAG: MBL fold metallo-hydrolase [Gammaproteobacteria bacterium]
MRVRILGCSGGIGAGLRTTSILIDDDVLIDAGTGVGDLTLDALKRIRHVFLTHAHLDHTAGLPLFIDTAFSTFADRPIEIHALAETIHALETHMFNGVMWPDFAALPSRDQPVLRFTPLEPGDSVTVHGRLVHAIEVSHGVPAVGYCVQAEGKVLAFSGDTARNRTLWPALNAYPNIDALLIEVSFPNRQAELARHAGHYCPQTFADDIRQLRHKPEIWLTAMKPGEEQTIYDEVRAALPRLPIHRLTRGDEIRL